MSLIMYADKFYYRYGTRRITDFITPKILDLNSIVLPYYSAMHFYNMESDILPDKANCRLLKFTKKAMVYFPLEYIDPNYKFMYRKTNETSYIRKLIREHKYLDFKVEPSFKFFRDIQMKSPMLRTMIPIVSYNFINNLYRHNGNYMNYYYQYYNASKTYIKNIGLINANTNSKTLEYPLHHFLIFDLPEFIYSKQIYLKFLNKEPNRQYLKTFHNYKQLFLFDFIKSFFSESLKDSVFNNFFLDSNKIELFKNTTILLRHGDKGVLLNLYFVYSLISSDVNTSQEDLEEMCDGLNVSEEDIAKLLNIHNTIKPAKFFNLFYFMLKNIYKLPAFTPEEIDKNKHMDVIAERLGLNSSTENMNKLEKKVTSKLVNKEPSEKTTSIIKHLITDKAKNVLKASSAVKNTEPNKSKDAEKEEEEDENFIKKEEDIISRDIDKKIKNIEKESSDASIEKILGLDDIKDELDVVEQAKYVTKYSHSHDLKKIMTEQPNHIEETNANLNELYENKQLDAPKYKKLMKTIETTLNKKDPFTNKKIKDVLDTKEDELKIDTKHKLISKEPKVVKEVAKSKAMLEDTIRARNKQYFKDVYNKDMLQSVMGINRAGLIVKDLKVDEHEDILGAYQNIEINVSDKGKSSYTIKTKIPKVDPKTGIFKISGNSYFLRNQRADLPIKKIAYNKVSLTSAYGKMFIVKAPYKKLDRGFSIKKQLVKLTDEGIIKNLVSGSIKTYDLKLPNDYAHLARYIKSFIYKGIRFNFNFNARGEIIQGLKYELDKIESKGKYLLTGLTPNKEPILMDEHNCLKVYRKGKYISISDVMKLNKKGECITIIDLLNLDVSKIKKEFSMVLIYKNYISTVLLLSYYMGLTNLLKTLKADYEIFDGRKIIKDPNTISVRFKFDTLVIKNPDELQTMILEGFSYYKKDMAKMDLNVLNNKDALKAIFNDLGFKLNVITEIEILEQLFVDAVTRSTLKQMHEPTTFVGLLLKASEMLLDDFYIHPNDMRGYMIKGYERIPQMVYSNIVDSIRKKKSEEFFGRSRLSVDPYAAWKMLNEDSASVLVDDLNPVVAIKQKEDTTYLGWLGRKKESMAKNTRGLHESDLGVISESSKDSGDVGITAYMTASPIINSVRGLKENKQVKDLEWANLVSTSAMLAPFILKDDPKRVVYNNIMNSHIVPIRDRKLFPIRTGYENILPYRIGSKFTGYVKEDGKVLKVSKSNIKVRYKTGKEETFNFSDWTSKEESGTTFKHYVKPNVKEGQTVHKGDIVYYDDTFFTPDPFEPNVVVYRPGTVVKVAFNETMETFEDATLISEELANKISIEYVKVRSIVLDTDASIKDFLKLGDKVKSTTPLFLLTSKLIGDEKLDKKTLDLMQAFVKGSPKAKYEGIIDNIDVRYNANKSDMSSSIRKLVDYSEAHMKDLETGKKFTGKVDKSYSVNGKSLEEGKIEIKYSIRSSKKMKTGDKAIIGHQLKTTVTNVNDKPMYTESGEVIDVMFSLRGVYARIVNSALLMGTTATLLEKVGFNAYEKYFGKKPPATINEFTK